MSKITDSKDPISPEDSPSVGGGPPESGETQLSHIPVLLEEAVSLWNRSDGEFFVDGTAGGGGHSERLLTLNPRAKVLCIDRDPEAVERVRRRLAPYGGRAVAVQGSYSHLPEILSRVGFPPRVDGIFLDLGMSSYQLDNPHRGFSWRGDGPLDMRFSGERGSGPTAAELLNTLSESKLAELFRRWGELRNARKLARTIVHYRKERPINTTGDFRALLREKFRLPPKAERDMLTKSFQALRIAVNSELHHLEDFLECFIDYLEIGGRIAIISFHSIEDRMVKRRFRDLATGCTCNWPQCVCGRVKKLKILTKKPIVPTPQEVERNPRSRSAKLRGGEKIG